MAAISLGTALAVGAISSAAGGATKSIIQSKAAKKAAQQQVRGTQEANRYMQQGMGQLSQLYSPYVNAGAGAMGTLGRLTTPGGGARYASPGPRPAPGGMYPPPGGQPVQGPYPMAEGGDVMVDKPTLFLAGEAGPERATFKPQGRPMGARGNAMGGYQFGGPQGGFNPGEQDRMRQMSQGGGRPPMPGGPMGNDNISQQIMRKSYPPRLMGAMFGPQGRGGGPPMPGGQPPMGGPRGNAMGGQFGRGGGPMNAGPFAQMAGSLAQQMGPGRPMPPGGPQRMAPPQKPDLAAYRAQGEAAGQDMSWMDQPGAISPEYL